MLVSFVVFLLLQSAGTTKPGSAGGQTPRPSSPVPAVNLPAETAALIAKASAAAARANLCQNQLAKDRELRHMLDGREIELKLQLADAQRELDNAISAVSRLTRKPVGDDLAIARTQQTSARSKVLTLEKGLGDIQAQIRKIELSEKDQLQCVQEVQTFLKSLS